MPTPRTAPIRMCVLETGRPRTVAPMTTPAADNSAANPDAGCIVVRLCPTVAITRRPMNHNPAHNATPNVTMAAAGTAALPSMAPVRSTSRIAANGPMALAMSLLPWLKAKPEAVKTCIQLNIKNVDRESDSPRSVLAKIKVAIHTAAPTIAMMK
ncbi:Uncharacterised protein [Mycobacterium tuberculosis]|nr:Uncharacterised protein [Mycobacterium tuberculosis]